MAETPDTTLGTVLGTIIIFTERMEELADFYQKALDIGPFERSPNHMGCRVGPVYLGFDQVEETEHESGGGVTLWFTVDDIQATFDHLVALGAQVRYSPTRKPWGGFLASLYDLDGNMLGLSQRES